MKKMATDKLRVVFSLLTILLLCFCPSVYGGETLPSGVERVHVHCVWDNDMNMIVDEGANAGQSIKIAVIDTGIWFWTDAQENPHYHEDLADNVDQVIAFRQRGGYVEPVDPVSDLDDYGHGTHVAGIIAAVDNAIGVIGNAPKASLTIIQIRGFQPLEAATAINWSVQHNIDIVSISLEFPQDPDDCLRVACENAYNNGLLLVACAGNQNNNSLTYPAAYECVVAVGAVYDNGSRWEYSNYCDDLDFMGPGVDINSTGLNNGYAVLTGTSMACPHVTAAAALVLASKTDPDYCYDGDNSTWNYDELYDKLRDTALYLGSSYYYGNGLINPWWATQRPSGDINNDLLVEGSDLILACRAYGCQPEDENWDPRADIDIDNVVSGDDLIIISSNYGEEDP